MRLTSIQPTAVSRTGAPLQRLALCGGLNSTALLTLRGIVPVWVQSDLRRRRCLTSIRSLDTGQEFDENVIEYPGVLVWRVSDTKIQCRFPLIETSMRRFCR